MSGVLDRRYLASLLLLLLFALLVSSVTMKSPTADEQNHLARGLAYWRTGDLRLSQEHPPGVNVWEAWPLLLDPRIHLPLEGPSWANAEWYGFADQLLWQVNDRPQQMIFATRVPVMWLTLVLAALVYRWARDLGGPWAGLMALALLVLDPNVLAHGRLTTTDMGITCTALAAMYALWRALRGPCGQGPRWAGWLWAGIALGAAQLSKFSALVLIPVAAIVVVARDLTGFLKPVRSLSILFVAAALTVWAGYAFTWGPIALLSGLPGPAPIYWAGVQAVLQRTAAGSPAFLMGQVSRQGWWYYFPAAFAIKTPLPTMILLAAAWVSWGVRRLGNRPNRKPARPTYDRSQIANRQSTNLQSIHPRPPNHPLCLVLPVLAFWAVAMAGSFNIGYRHILPSLPFLYILGGWGVRELGNRETGKSANVQRPPKVTRSVCHLLSAVCYLWLAIEALSVTPHFLAYFNQIAGGPDAGYRFLVDSNLDWGQDLPGLKCYVEQEGIARVTLSWFGAAHPEAYGFPFHPLPGFWRFGGEAAAYGYNPYAPAPGVYAISATNLQGVKLADRDLYAWFREREPDAQVGYSILIYNVPSRETTASGEAAVLGVPLSQLAQEERDLLRHVDSVRQYDPQTGAIVPSGARTIWYITPQPPGWGEAVREGSGYALIRGSPAPAPTSEGEADFGGFVAPLSYLLEPASPAPGETFTLTLYWQVARAPHRAAISFAHLLDAEGRYLAGWDGLTAPATCWQEGDWIEQRYAIPLPAGLKAGTYQVEVGWYDAETGERWPYVVRGEQVGDRWLLPDGWKVGQSGG